MNNLVQQLQELGFSQYEAQAYITLLQHTPLTGYELAKFSGIPRPSIYPVLQKLEERGAILRMEGENAARYSPVPVDEFISRLQKQYRETLDAASEALSKIHLQEEGEPVWSLSRYPVLLDLARSLIGSAREKLLVAVSPLEAAALGEEMAAAEARQVQITTLCLAECRRECGGCRGKVHRMPVAADPQQDRWLILTRDGEELLAGEIHPQDETNAVRTRQRMLVNLASWYIRQSIALAAILQGPGGQQEGLGPERRALLESLDTADARPSWAVLWKRFIETE